MRSLKELKLNHMELAGAGIQHLARCPQLEKLEVLQSDIPTDCAEYFGRITSLQSLNLAAGRFERFRLRGLRRLRTSILHGSDCTEFEFTDLPLLESLDISCNRIDQLVLGNLPRLTTLGIYTDSISEEAVESIGDVPALRHLYVSHSSVSNDGLRAIGRLSSLEDLLLWNTTVDDRAMGAFDGLRRLKKLRFRASAVTQHGLDHLRHLRSLKHLTLREIGGEGDFSLVLSSLPYLR